MEYLGIDIGSTNVKATFLADGRERFTEIIAHEGDIPRALLSIIQKHCAKDIIKAVCTGNTGRKQLKITQVILPESIEAALEVIGERPDAVVSLGGETIVVYKMLDGHIAATLTGDKCAAGTGEFLCQQLARMDMDLDVLNSIPYETRVHTLSSRCSVFMKTDCTHKLNKREATKEEIVVSLTNVMAGKVVEFLTRARVTNGRVLLIGGVTRNPFIQYFLNKLLPDIDFFVPKHAHYFEALGAAHLVKRQGARLTPNNQIFQEIGVKFERYDSLAQSENMVNQISTTHGRIIAGREYVLGIDGGSTTTKAVLVDIANCRICASWYGKTHGDPVKALCKVLIEIRKQVRKQISDSDIKISLAATTGSSREILGVFVETMAVYNEIIAHTVGTTNFYSKIDTIFEIGGQDAKYVYLSNGVPIDYAMNEACSAGTGSFLEESAKSDLNIYSAADIGPIAMKSEKPLKFGGHCSAFINSDIRTAIQQGAKKEDIVAGLVITVHEQALAEAVPAVCPADLVAQQQHGVRILVLHAVGDGGRRLVTGIQAAPVAEFVGPRDDQLADGIVRVIPINQAQVVVVGPERVTLLDGPECFAFLRR